MQLVWGRFSASPGKNTCLTEVLTRASLPSIYIILMRSQLRWAGHVVHMKNHRLRRNCSSANCLRLSAPKEARKSALKTHWRSLWNLSASTLTAWNIWRRTETNGGKFSNVERKFVKQEETQQLSCAGNLEKSLPHQPLQPPFLIFTGQDSSVHRLASFAILTTNLGLFYAKGFGNWIHHTFSSNDVEYFPPSQKCKTLETYAHIRKFYKKNCNL